MNTATTTVRIAAFFAAVGVTTLLVTSQFGLARHYADAGSLLWAGQSVPAPVVQAAPASAARAG